MKTKQIKWLPVSTRFSTDFHPMTMVKVKGWCRPGYATWWEGEKRWDLGRDPAVIKNNNKITHWLAVPRIKS